MKTQELYDRHMKSHQEEYVDCELCRLYRALIEDGEKLKKELEDCKTIYGKIKDLAPPTTVGLYKGKIEILEKILGEEK